MSKFAIVIDGVVDNVLVADSHETGIDVTGTAVGPGWTYDGETFSAPVVVVPDPEPVTVYAKRDFVGLFSLAEISAIVQAKATDATVLAFCYILEAALTVSILDADTIAGVQYLESVGLIATGRAAEILS